MNTIERITENRRASYDEAMRSLEARLAAATTLDERAQAWEHFHSAAWDAAEAYNVDWALAALAGGAPEASVRRSLVGRQWRQVCLRRAA